MNNHLQKSSAPFSTLFGIFKENSTANFSGRTNFCRDPFEFCGRNFGPLATLFSPSLGTLGTPTMRHRTKCPGDSPSQRFS
jgi:hypothetical protein